ncbi:MAG: TRAP transporter permease [Thermodesulfobacteriota bacterium]|nr:TRAP transporter permease [Thermodesulfobacteriota bacterium]
MVEKEKRIFKWLTSIGFVSFSCYHLYTTALGIPVSYLHRPLHVTLAIALGFLIYGARGKKNFGHPAWYDVILAGVALISFGSVAANYTANSERLIRVDPLSLWNLVVGGLGVMLILEIARRSVGWVLSAVAAIFLIYSQIGPLLPSLVAHKGFSIKDTIDYLSFGLEGIYSVPIGVSSTYIVIFIIFGTFLEKSGAGEVLMDLGRAIVGRYRGGPAKVAVLTSAFFGTISGSAAANVYATGTFTIPMMKRMGYSPTFAGAVEASASTGGQLMPPVMGAAAFLMADILGVPYLQICKAALIPAVLYFFSILVMVDFEAARLGLKGLETTSQPLLKDTLKRSYLLIPIFVLLAIMIMGYTPFRAAFVATGCAVFVSFFSSKHRMGFRRCFETLVLSGERTVLIASACAAAGLIIGIVTLTGIGLNISSIIITSSGGITLVALLLVMIASIIMGMGTPTTVAYIIVATLGVPSLEQLKFLSLPAHFFVFYFGVLSMVTPPVAIAAYAAAEIAKEDMLKIGFKAVKLCFVAFLIPFMFIYEPGLLMEGPWTTIFSEFTSALIGVIALAASFQGWFLRPLGFWMRIVFFLAAFMLIMPGLATNVVGLAVFLSFLGRLYLLNSRARTATHGGHVITKKEEKT